MRLLDIFKSNKDSTPVWLVEAQDVMASNQPLDENSTKILQTALYFSLGNGYINQALSIMDNYNINPNESFELDGRNIKPIDNFQKYTRGQLLAITDVMEKKNYSVPLESNIVKDLVGLVVRGSDDNALSAIKYILDSSASYEQDEASIKRIAEQKVFSIHNSNKIEIYTKIANQMAQRYINNKDVTETDQFAAYLDAIKSILNVNEDDVLFKGLSGGEPLKLHPTDEVTKRISNITSDKFIELTDAYNTFLEKCNVPSYKKPDFTQSIESTTPGKDKFDKFITDYFISRKAEAMQLSQQGGVLLDHQNPNNRKLVIATDAEVQMPSIDNSGSINIQTPADGVTIASVSPYYEPSQVKK